MEILKIPCDMDNFTFEDPVAHHGHYSAKLVNRKRPIYIELPTCKLKHDLQKSGKHIYCDLLFEDQGIEEWTSEIEKKCHELIVAESPRWFESSLTLEDIGSIYSSFIKHSGKAKYARFAVKVNVLTGSPVLPIYQEDDADLNKSWMNNILPVSVLQNESSSPLRCIVEIQGIRFKTHIIHFEIEVKQIVLLSKKKNTPVDENSNVFEKCLITPYSRIAIKFEKPLQEKGVLVEETKEEVILPEVEKNSPEAIDVICEELLTEVDEIPLDPAENIQIKPSREVYEELYRNALEKAKKAKKLANEAIQNAESIKKLYLTDPLI